MDRRVDFPLPPDPDPEGSDGTAGSTAPPYDDDGLRLSHAALAAPSLGLGLDAWSDPEITDEQLEEEQEQLEGLPAYDDVLDLIVLDVDDDDLDDDDDDALAAPEPTTSTSTMVVESMAMPDCGPTPPPPSLTPCATPRPRSANEYYVGLGKRLEQFAPLAVPVDCLDSDNQGQIRDRLAAIERFRAQNVAQAVQGANADAMALARQDRQDSGSGPPICRICRDTYPYGVTEDDNEGGPGGNEDESEDAALVAPCECRGTVGRVHMSCLERWLAESDSSCCELCGHQYTTIRTPRYGVLASIPAWIFHNGSADLLFDIVAFIIFTPVTLFGAHLGLYADDTPYFQVSIMAALDLVYSAWLAMRLHYHASRWYSWWRRKSTVKVILDKEEKKNN